MKKVFIISVLLLMGLITYSQYVAVLHSSDTIAAFTGSAAFVQAYNLSESGDTIYLSGGGFTFTNIQKELYIIGAGIHPDYTTATSSTKVLNNFQLANGASGSKFEGIEFLGTITKLSYVNVDDVSFKRCKFNESISFDGNGAPTLNSENYHFSECIVIGNLNLKGISYSTVSNCILEKTIQNSNTNSFKNCSFLYQGYNGYNTVLYNCSTTMFMNCIFHSNSIYIDAGTSNIYYNNLFTDLAPLLGTSPTESDNYKDVSLETIFLSTPSSSFSFEDIYELNPSEIPNYLGTDGLQIGIYGGLSPVKEGFVPKNPHILMKNIEHNTNEDGLLPVQFEVESQEE